MIDKKEGHESKKKHKHCFHLKEHDEGVGDGKADAEDEYEEIDDEHLGVAHAQDHKMQKCCGAVIIMTYVCYFHPVTVIAADHCHNSHMHLHKKNECLKYM